MFEPAFCPNPSCEFHTPPPSRFFLLHGSYQPRCRPRPVPRFRCTSCFRTFSRQTFRFDYRLRKPHLATSLFRHLVSGGSLRQAARNLAITRRTVAAWLARLARHARSFHGDALRGFPADSPNRSFQFDELESYEGDRILKPLTVGTLLQEGTRFLVGFAVGTLRSRTSKSLASKERRKAFEEQHGRRRNESREVIEALLEPLKKTGVDGGSERLTFTTDEKTIYPVILKRTFPRHPPRHVRVSSRLKRDGGNPLTPINHLDLMTRHHNARLQRESLASSKKRIRLIDQLSLFLVWWNYARLRVNSDTHPPAYYAGVHAEDGRAKVGSLFGWRQDLGAGKLPRTAA